MSVYIPPEDLRFRLVGYISQCAIFSRTTLQPEVGHYNVSHGLYPDQWFTLLHGYGDHAGLYAIKGEVTNKVLFSRSQSPTVGHIDGYGKYGDNWFQIEPESGQYVGHFRLITPSTGLTLYSRVSPDPTFANYTASNFYSDQLFTFQWEGMKVDKVDFDLNAGKVISSTPISIAEQVLTNNSDQNQEMSFSVNKSITNTSTFEYSSGFTVTLGLEFTAGVPVISEGKFSVSSSNSHTWTWGRSNQYGVQYTATFPVMAGPHKSIRGTSVVNEGTLNVPYTITMSSIRSGVRVQASGMWHGVSSWDLRHTITPLN